MPRNRALLPPIGYSLFSHLSVARFARCANERRNQLNFAWLSPGRLQSLGNNGLGGSNGAELWDWRALLALSIRCGEGDFLCLGVFLKMGKNWQLSRVAVIFSRMVPARNRLYELVKRIPKGRVLTYGQLARATRLPGGARAAGRAMAASPRGQAIPWHRVVAAGGRIVVREPFASLQRRLLESEGARLVHGRVALAEHAWTPPRSTKAGRQSSSPKSRPRRPKRPRGTKARS